MQKNIERMISIKPKEKEVKYLDAKKNALQEQ